MILAANPMFGWMDNGVGFYFFTLPIRWYAICIITGAVLALLASNYRAHKRGLPRDVFNSLFLIAFPTGIIGARIWYVIATWPGPGGNYEYTTNFWNVFKIWEGGLAIQGGAIGGVLAGILFLIFRRKGWDVLDAVDCAIPTILIGQIIGRWGNYVNQEVYGLAVSEQAWGFLGIINQRMYIYSPSDSSTLYRAPLFFLEAIMNVGGYFFITRIIPICFSKFYKTGDQAFSYFIWYGLIRMVLEPLRDTQFNMGADTPQAAATNNMQAMWMGLVFVIAGIVAIVANHLIRAKIDQRKSHSTQQ